MLVSYLLMSRHMLSIFLAAYQRPPVFSSTLLFNNSMMCRGYNNLCRTFGVTGAKRELQSFLPVLRKLTGICITRSHVKQ